MEGMISFMTDTNPQNGIGSINTSLKEKKTLASESLSWNKQHKLFNEIFPDIDDLLETILKN
jgi:hypothetical protein